MQKEPESLLSKRLPALINLVRPAGLEPAAYGLGNRRSIRLSYGRIPAGLHTGRRTCSHTISLRGITVKHARSDPRDAAPGTGCGRDPS